MKLVQQVCHAYAEMGKERLAYFSPKCKAIIPLSKEYIPISTRCAIWLQVGE